MKKVKEKVTFRLSMGKLYTGTLVEAKYQDNNRTALMLIDQEGVVATVTVNVPEEPLAENEMFIKDYSENAGILQQFIDQGILSEPISHIDRGWVRIPKVKYLL